MSRKLLRWSTMLWFLCFALGITGLYRAWELNWLTMTGLVAARNVVAPLSVLPDTPPAFDLQRAWLEFQ